MKSKNELVPEELEKNKALIMAQLRDDSMSGRDPRELAYKQIVDYLFDYSKLLMVARLSEDLAKTILKNKIVIYFFHDYYSEIDVRIRFTQIPEPPYYRRSVDYSPFTKALKEKLLKKYPQMLDDVMAITVSFSGKGRGEALDILKAADNEIERQKSLLNPFGGTKAR